MRIPLNERERIAGRQLVHPDGALYRRRRYGWRGATTGHSLKRQHDRALLGGVISSGNRNFGEAYGRAGDVIAGNAACRGCTVLNSSVRKADVENIVKE
ncbi:class Ib ribonucleoside-diphosphate reductase assembly flavoprotein NrdI [Shigella flexneri]